jgi:hypothetical protein
MVSQLQPEPRYTAVRGTRIRRFSRGEFFSRRWRYKNGEHVAIIAPTQDGKTVLGFQLLKITTKPTLPGIVLVMKPRDPTPAVWTKHLGYPELPAWPPPKPYPWQAQPSGYTLWPRHTFIVEVDNEHLSEQFAAAIQWAYKRGNCIVFADEIYGLLAELDGLQDDLIALWSRGGGMGTGLWAATQRPAGSAGHGVPGFMYSNSTHLFFGKDPDKRSRQRYGEIGGVDAQLLEAVVLSLRKYEFAYVHRGDANGGPYICILEAS